MRKSGRGDVGFVLLVLQASGGVLGALGLGVVMASPLHAVPALIGPVAQVVLAFAVARHWPQVFSNAVDPGWVPTRMGGSGAPDDLEEGHLTQAWLAASDDAAAKTSGGLWYHREKQKPAAQSLDPRFQDELMAKLAQLTGVKLF